MKKLHAGTNSIITQQGDRVKKRFNLITPEISVTCLKALSFSIHFPKLLSFDEKSITVNYCGEQLTRDNLPDDWENQMSEIVSDLQTAGIRHNDCVPKNLLIKDGVVVLIDFGMAIVDGKHSEWKKTPAETENILKEDDATALRRAFDFIRGKKIDRSIALEIVPPYQLSNDTEWKNISRAISVFGTQKVYGSSMGPGRLYQKFPFHIKENDLAPRSIKHRVEMMNAAYNFKGKVGIDYGCGTGAMVFALSKLGASCFGVERDQQALDVAWAIENYYETGARFFVGDLLKHIDMMCVDCSNGVSFPFLVRRASKRLDFCLFLSVFMWILKDYGLEKATEAIYNLGELFDVMFFETSLGDAGAGDEMKREGLTSVKLVVDFIEKNSSFRFVKSLGKSKDWYDRETIMFKRSTKKSKVFKKKEMKQPIHLNLGCGTELLPGYVNCDLYGEERKINVRLDAKDLPFKDGSVDGIRAYHLIEHFDFKEGFNVLREWCRVLKPGGELVLETPDMLNSCKKFVEGNEQVRITLYGHFWAWPWIKGQAHKFLYTETQLTWTLSQTGFDEIKRVNPDSIYARSNPEWPELYLKMICRRKK